MVPLPHRLEDIRSILPRRFLLRNIGLELIMEGGSSVYFAFDDPKQRWVFTK